MIFRSTGSDQQYAVYVVRLHYIGDEAAVLDDLLLAGAHGQGDHPAHRLHLHAAKLRQGAKPFHDLRERCAVNARRKATGIIERRDQSAPLLVGGPLVILSDPTIT